MRGNNCPSSRAQRGDPEFMNNRLSCGSVEAYLEANFTPFILNCKDLEYINSSGLTSIIHLSQMLESFHLKLALCELQPQVKEVIDIAAMETYFNIYPTEKEAFENL